ncbi:MAG TPA: caspase family protein [Tenuifilaceae bacterium]|nr:caspase family protein [Tenuifilaceae bacterium]HPE17875.1 caspase family protein [Tenuifilaceae bacterium]HPJ45351.1 caspase family protein [Tenuifilaceae bacterium]HPQ33592.1 caspase family protein [Tenuifilaceae bacterium]HRX67394.1 caspase family protein [Tenuifilaceae bacterium]
MKRFVKNLAVTLGFTLTSALFVQSQEFTDINVKQLGSNVNLEYSIIGEQIGQTFNVSPSYSVDGGRSFLPMKSVSGYVGASVLGGKNQVIIWNVLNDLPALQGDVVFKLSGNSKSTQALEDEFSKVKFKLISLHKTGTNQLELVLSITNTGATRDLKLINGLITITDFKKQQYDAQRGKLGEVIGGQRYSTPTRTIKTNETVEATFVFDRIPSDLNRVMRLDIGAELLTYDIGLDLEIGRLQYRDFPISDKPTGSMSVNVSKTFETTAAAKVSIEKPKPAAITDSKPPMVTILSPEGVTLIGSEATRGRPYAQSSTGLDDKRLRSIASGEGIQVSEKSIFIKGTASDENGIYEVVINGNDAKLNSDGTFEATILLKVGRNDIVIRSMDTKQNSVEKRFVVYRIDSPNQKAKSDTEELDIIFDAPKTPRFYAFIVGVNDYPDAGIASLSNPVSDAEKLRNVLVEKYMFEPNNVVFIKNATRAQIIDEFDRLTRRVGKNDNLLVFFAGHGYFDTETELGYWLPSDATASSTANWMANSQIKDYVAAIKSKHTLLIADACFSGGIFKTRKAFADATDNVDKVYDKPSRKAMTSGALTEVPDKSVFLELLVQRLDENTLGYLPAEELFSSFKTAVMNSSPTVPQYGDIKGTGDEGGDFIFVRR